jgi:hypothetical protein
MSRRRLTNCEGLPGVLERKGSVTVDDAGSKRAVLRSGRLLLEFDLEARISLDVLDDLVILTESHYKTWWPQIDT